MDNRLSEMFKFLFSDEYEEECDVNKTAISQRVFEKVKGVCDVLELSAEEHGDGTVAGNLQSARMLSEYMVNDMRVIAERVTSAEDDVYDKDLDEATAELSRCVTAYRELCKDMERLGRYLCDTALCLRDLVAPHDWMMLYSDEEIARVLEERFIPDSDMFIAYREGEYAFIFKYDDVESEPFVFARGDEDSYPAIKECIDRFLSIEIEA